MPQTKTAPQTLCEPVQSKRTSTCQKSHFTRKFTGKRPPDRISPGHLQSWRPRKPFLEVSQIAQLGSPDSQPTPRRRSRYDPPRVQEGGPEKVKFPPKVVFVVVSKYFPISHILDDHHAPHLLSEFSRVDADSRSRTLHLS